ncbi:MAG: hypothetical protein FWE67_05800 [Planctomycetaceae bacterium]|nr:hypothetical protein [Planctomycetaceae bacterium]
MDEAVRKIAAYRTVECNMQISTVVKGNALSSQGKYEEQNYLNPASPFQKRVYRQEIFFPMDNPAKPGAEPNRSVVVCQCAPVREEGKVWFYQTIEGTKSYRYVQLAELENAVIRSRQQQKYPMISVIRQLGGLAGTLSELAFNFDLDGEAKPDVINNTVTNDENTGKENVWKITGKLKKSQFDNMLKQMGGVNKKKQYPPELLTDIEICLRQDNLFPARIRHLHRNSEEALPETVLMEIVYHGIKLNGEVIPEYRFAMAKPDGVFKLPEDITTQFIRSLGLR